MRLNPFLSPLLFPNLTAENRQCFDPKKKQEKRKLCTTGGALAKRKRNKKAR